MKRRRQRGRRRQERRRHQVRREGTTATATTGRERKQRGQHGQATADERRIVQQNRREGQASTKAKSGRINTSGKGKANVQTNRRNMSYASRLSHTLWQDTHHTKTHTRRHSRRSETAVRAGWASLRGRPSACRRRGSEAGEEHVQLTCMACKTLSN